LAPAYEGSNPSPSTKRECLKKRSVGNKIKLGVRFGYAGVVQW
jgi:hypothetical protein